MLPGAGRERDNGEPQTPGQGGPQPGLGPRARHPAGHARAAGARCPTLPQVCSECSAVHQAVIGKFYIECNPNILEMYR